MSQTLSVSHPRKQCPPHNSLKHTSGGVKVTGVPPRPFAKRLLEIVTDQVSRGHVATMRASRRSSLAIAHLVKSDWLLLKPENVPDPGASQPIVSATKSKVNISMLRVNPECSIELSNPR